MQLIVLAAGRGSRLPKKFRNKPKCLAEVNKKPIINYNLNFFKKFNSRLIITGYKSKYLKDFCIKNKFKMIINKEYKSTNMVHSMFLASRSIKSDIVICYGDIIFDPKIYELFKKEKNIMPINSNWLTSWKKRMALNEIKKDAENLEIKKKTLLSVGGSIERKYPKYQYMGIFKLSKKNYVALNKLYKKINNRKIDMTNFINKALQLKKLKIETKIYKSYWYEIDTGRDLNLADKEIR